MFKSRLPGTEISGMASGVYLLSVQADQGEGYRVLLQGKLAVLR